MFFAYSVFTTNDMLACGSGASAFITANPSGRFVLASQTPSQTCTYRIIAPSSNGWNKVSLSCSFTSGTFARKTVMGCIHKIE